MSKIEIELPRVLAEFLESQVEAGLYTSVSDAVEYAIRREFTTGFDVERVRAQLARGVAEADAGIYYDGAMSDIIADAKAARAKQK